MEDRIPQATCMGYEASVESETTCFNCSKSKRRNNLSKRSVLPRTMQPLIVCFFLQFLLTFAQGQGQGGAEDTEKGASPIDEKLIFQVYEGQPPGTLVGTVPIQSDLSYMFLEEPAQFTLDDDTGEIRTSMRIDRESLAQDTFDLVITSSPATTHVIEVSIKVLDLNDNFPTFGQTSIEINFSENDQPGTQVILDTATDKDIDENDVTNQYEIVSGNSDGKFRLVLLDDTSIPLLYIENTEKLDREEKALYQLNISAQDGGNPPKYGYLLVNITVRDFNDNPPVFDQSDYRTSANETTPVGTSIIQVRATDQDTGNNADITYKVLNDDINQFSINPKTGVVRTLKKLECQRSCDGNEERCEQKSCFVTIEASDNGQPAPQQAQTYITVIIIDENDHDPVLSFRFFPNTAPYAMVDESAEQNSLVAIVTVSDPDDGINGQTTVEIIKGNELGHFNLQPQFSVYAINVAGKIDREVISKYNLTLVARDLGEPSRSSTAFLIIMVNDINDHEPKFQQSEYHAQLSELVPVGSFVAGMTATDNDTGLNAQIQYSIMSGNALGWFRIDPVTGLVTTSKLLDRETRSILTLSVRAQDGASKPQSSIAKLIITIWDENDEQPTFPQSAYNIEVVEGTPEVYEIISVTAVDHDQGNNGSVRYSFDPEVEINYPGMFQLNHLSGKISTRRSIDREEFDHFTIVLYSEDQGTPSLTGSTTVFVNVSDLNDNIPVLYPLHYYGAVQETDPAFTPVLKVSATDQDSGTNGQIRYSISQGSDQRFEINEDNGWIRTTQQLDKSIKSTYRITVSVQDLGNKFGANSAMVEINVMDNREILPAFSQLTDYVFSVREDSSKGEASIGRRIGQVEASGPGLTISYRIVNGDPRGLFVLDERTGYITSSAAVDREEQAFYSLDIVASAGNTFAATKANITIEDINDNAPTFSRTSASGFVVENWPVGHDIFLAQAHDPDMDDNALLEYRMEQGSSSVFYIDSVTGMILLGQSLTQTSDRQFSLLVTATDSGTPQYSAQLSVSITVIDVNDHTPMFTQISYEVSVNESIAINDLFYNVLATDDDYGPNADVCYEIVKGNIGGKFGIFPNGQLYIAHALDRETHDLYVLTIKAYDKAIEQRSSLANVTVHVLDDNDNTPVFTNTTYVMDIEEGSEIGNYVGTVYASDKDTGANAELFYSFEGPHDGFSLHAKSGVITNTLSFDREEQVDIAGVDYVMLTVVVNDNGEPSKTAKADIQITILDSNDNPPEFQLKVYSPSVFENAEVDVEVIKVYADDLDDGDNAEITYSILTGNERDSFRMDSLNGQLLVNAQLDRESKDSYYLVVMATDSGYPPLNSTCEIHISVLDYNDNVPVFLDMISEYSVSENAHHGEFICQVSAVDQDLGNKALVTYGIVNNLLPPVFTIDSSTGKVSLVSELDFETSSRYSLNISAEDNGTPSLTGYIEITVYIVDYNDNAPRFSNTAVTRQISEGVSPSSPVGTVTATDPDSGINGMLRYGIIKQVPVGQNFSIDAVSGEIRTATQIDREVADNFKLTIVASDQALPLDTRKTAVKAVTIIIQDVNDNSPRFITQNAVQVVEGAQPNTRITQIKAVDLDVGDNGKVTYNMTSGDKQIFSIEESTGNLYLRSSLPAQLLSYDLTFLARDHGSNPRSTYGSINVFVRSNIENGPQFTQSRYDGELFENQPADTSILTVHAEYEESTAFSSNVEYKITDVKSNGVDQPRYFTINPYSGKISSTEPLDRESGYDIFNVVVYAVEKGTSQPRTRSTMVEIRVLDVDDCAPMFVLPEDELEVSEDVNAGYLVTTMEVTDADLDGAVKYSLSDGASGHFDIDITTGEITVVAPLDREAQATYDLVITADDGTLSSSVILHILVTDINDEKPVFSSQWYSFNVPENTQTGLSIGQLHATDSDSGHNARVTYAITSHWGRDKFSLDPNSGVLRLIGALDYQQLTHYVLTVKAQDSGSPSPLSSSATVYVNVMDYNNNAPVFDMSSYRTEVREDADVGTSILTVTATDVDSGVNSRVEYSIVGGDPNRLFSVEPVTGVLRVAKPLDREEQAYYNLALQAQDQADNTATRFSSTAMVTVDLLDTNDNAPVFQSPSIITVSENSATGSSVYAIVATDSDQNENGKIQYHLVSNLGNMFALGENDGVLRVAQELDREMVDEYLLNIQASDQGNPTKSTSLMLRVKIGDENDHEPVFDPRLYSKEIDEDVPVGTRLVELEATDMDIGLNAELRYMIKTGDDNHDFYVNPKTGELSVKKRLDYERRQEYSLSITVHDLGKPQHSDMATVSIKLNDVNDCSPMFHDAPYVAYVQENVVDVPVHVMTVSARDDDSKANGEVTYSFSEGDTHNFAINGSTGEITATNTLDREEASEYHIILQAMDKGLARLRGYGTVTILVGDANDNPPLFRHAHYNGRVTENMAANTRVAQITAEDADDGKNAQIRYNLQNDANGKFQIHPLSGVISSSMPLDREEQSEYVLVAQATDTGSLPLSSTTLITVRLEDENDNQPQFLQSQYKHYLRDPTTAGWFVAGVTALDADHGNNGEVEYSIVESGARQTFEVDPVTGVITAIGTLSATNSDVTQRFHVRATDKGVDPLSSDVLLEIIFLPSTTSGFPQFFTMQHNYVLSESINVGYNIQTVSAGSSRNGASLSYHIAAGNQHESFHILPNSGQLRVQKPLDYELVTAYTLWLSAQDDSTEPPLRDYIQLDIEISDENDCVPVFDGLYFNASVPENEYQSVNVISVTASDADSGDNGRITYQLVSGNEGDVFKIDSPTGRITTKRQLDREMLDSYLLVVHATDHGSERNTATATVDITVLDRNDKRPRFTEIFTERIPENAPNGTFVLKVISEDEDIGDNAFHVYSLTKNPDNKFAIDPYSGNITVAGQLDRENRDEYLLNLAANDGSYNAATQVSITILDANDNAPQFQQASYSFIIAELQAINTPVGKVSATDLDAPGPNADIYFRFEPASGEFQIDPATGVISAQKMFEFKPDGMEASPENVYQLTVLASDRGEPAMFTAASVTITVQEANRNAPVFQNDKYTAAVSEDAMTGQQVTMVTASDVGTGMNSVLSYSIDSGNGSALFYVNPNSGIISVSQTLQNQKAKTYHLRIKAVDHGQPPKAAFTQVYIQVSTVNVYQPEFTSSPSSFRVTVAENYAVQEVVTIVTAIDRDEGPNGIVQYSITSGDPQDQFVIDHRQGYVRVNKPLDYESQTVHYLNITAKDSGLLPKQKSQILTVYVSDVNDSPPVFELVEYKAFVTENSQRDTSVFTVVAEDADSPSAGSILYYITGDTIAIDSFAIDSTSGLITATADIDYETISDYNLQIKAINPGTTLSGTTVIHVHVNGENEFTPLFIEREYSFEVSESAEMGQSIGQVQAVDMDHGNEGIVYYYLIGDSNMEGFTIDANTGDVRISKPIDREATSEIRLKALAKNGGPILGNDTDECVIRIVVGDANDPPRFAQKLYEGEISEGASVGMPVLTVTAFDKDEKQQDRFFTYSIYDGNVGDAFKISRNTGQISSNRILDREAINIYNLTIAAIDTGTPPGTGTTLVKVFVGDINDNGPHFQPEIPVGAILENQVPMSSIGVNLIQFTNDRDLDPNQEPYRYRLVDHTDIFDVGITSGYVKAKVSLDRESVPGYSVKVEVGDNGNPVMTATLTFNINVQDENDNPSKPRPLEVHVFAFNDEFSGYKLASVQPNDVDTVGDYRCQVTGGDLTKFSIRNACNLYANQIQNGGEYKVDISGSDGIHDSVSYEVSVLFQSFDENTVDSYHTTITKLGQVTAPEFLEKNYKKFISTMESSVLGSTILLFGMREQVQEDGSTSLILLLAARSSNGYLTRNQLAQKMSDAKVTIENTAGVRIDSINYTPCLDTICANGAECTYSLDMQVGEYSYHESKALTFTSPKVLLSTMCNCREGFTGTNCLQPVNKCQQNPCQHSGTCIDQQGSYKCQCIPEYQGDHCEIHIDVCVSSPCQNSGSCRIQDAGYMCDCQFGYYGQLCEKSAKSFQELSFVEYDLQLDQQQNRIHLEIATLKTNALLFYSPVSADEYMAVEIVGNHVEFSFSLGSNITRIFVPRLVTDGMWYRIEAERTRNEGTLKVTPCGSGVTCEMCDDNDSQCFARAAHGKFENLDANESLFVGGVPDLALLLDHPHRVSSTDFTGCMRRAQVDKVDLFGSDWSPVQEVGTGKCAAADKSGCAACVVEGAVCQLEWGSDAWCQCPDENKCDKEADGFSFGSDAMVKYTMKPSIKQDQLLQKAKIRARRSILSAQRTISMSFRMVEEQGVLFHAAMEDDYTLIYVNEKRVHYYSQSGGLVLSHDQEVNNGEWHSVNLTVSGDIATLYVDKSSKRKTFENNLADPLALEVIAMTLGKTEEAVKIPGTSEQLKGFSGCMDDFRIDGTKLPLGGKHSKYNVETSGEVSATCEAFLAASVPEEGPPITIVIIVIVVFFVVVIISILAACFIIRARRRSKHNKQYSSQNGAKANGSAADKSDSRSHQDSGYTEGGGEFNEEQIIRQHIADEMHSHMFNEREVNEQVRPDIIGEEAPSMHDANVTVEHTGMDNIGYQDEPPEHYDIDNASSIAPSDLVDVVGHYKRYRSGNLSHGYGPHHKLPIGGHRHGNPSPNHLLMNQRLSNQSPASLSSQSRSSPNIMQPPIRQSPMTLGGSSKSPLTINNIQHYNQLNRLTPNHLARGTSPLPRGASPAPNIPPTKRGPSPSMRSTPLSGISGLFPGNMSDSSLSTTDTRLPNNAVPRPNSKLKQPINQIGVRASMNTPTPVQGLTVEEVNRLNARHKLSPVSTVDAVSTSSEDPNANNINRTDFSHSDLLDPTAMMPPESSSEDETNDSFTCSEMEYESDNKTRYDLHTPGRGFPSRLPRVDEIDTDTTLSRTMNTLETDSNHDSISTFFTSDDEPSHRLAVRSKLPNGALNWDYLLNWGPNFEKLVGVFSDIAQLPDSDTDNSGRRQNKFPASSRMGKSPPPRPPKTSRQSPSEHPHSSLPHMFSNGISSSPGNMSQSPINIPNSPKSRSPITSSSPAPNYSSIPSTPIPPLAMSNHPKAAIPVGSVPPHPRSPHPKSPTPKNPSPQPKATMRSQSPQNIMSSSPQNIMSSSSPLPLVVTKSSENSKDTVNESYLEEYV